MADAKAHWQSQDAARQAIASRQLLEVIQLKTDAGTFDQAALGAYASGCQCAHKVASACKQAEASVPYITAWAKAGVAYGHLLIRCGQIIQGSSWGAARRRTRWAFPRERSS